MYFRAERYGLLRNFPLARLIRLECGKRGSLRDCYFVDMFSLERREGQMGTRIQIGTCGGFLNIEPF